MFASPQEMRKTLLFTSSFGAFDNNVFRLQRDRKVNRFGNKAQSVGVKMLLVVVVGGYAQTPR